MHVARSHHHDRLAPSDLQELGTFPIVVHNPMPGGGASEAIPFEITD